MITFWYAGCDNGSSSSGGGSGKPSPDNRPIVCLGDSLTEGYGASIAGEADKSKSYPAFLQEKVTVTVVNAGISGDTAASGLARVGSDVLSQNPQMVIILLGANDLFRSLPLSGTKASLSGIIGALKTGNRKIYLASFIGNEAWENSIVSQVPGMTPPQISSYLSGYKTMFAELISENPGVVFIPDIWTGVWGVNMSDQIHANAEGYRTMAENIFTCIKPYLLENNLLR